MISLSFSSDGQHLVSSGYDGLARLWHTATGQCVRTLVGSPAAGAEGPPRIGSVRFTPNDAFLLATTIDDGAVRLWAADTGLCVRTFMRGGEVSATLPLGAALVRPRLARGRKGGDSGAAEAAAPAWVVAGGEDGNCMVWELQSRRIEQVLPVGGKGATVLAVDVGEVAGRVVLAAGSFDGSVYFFEAAFQ